MSPSSPSRWTRSSWPHLKLRLIEVFASKTREEWCSILEATDVCFAPVLTMTEAAEHPHNVERETFIDIAGTIQPAPAPRFSRTAAEVAMPPAHAGQHSVDILRDWGFDESRIDALIASRAVVAA